jgi:hypothetical protein
MSREFIKAGFKRSVAWIIARMGEKPKYGWEFRHTPEQVLADPFGCVWEFAQTFWQLDTFAKLALGENYKTEDPRRAFACVMLNFNQACGDESLGMPRHKLKALVHYRLSEAMIDEGIALALTKGGLIEDTWRGQPALFSRDGRLVEDTIVESLARFHGPRELPLADDGQALSVKRITALVRTKRIKDMVTLSHWPQSLFVKKTSTNSTRCLTRNTRN